MRTATLLQDDQSQVIRLPQEFKLGGDGVFIKRLGNAILLIPYQDPWQSLFNSLDQFSDDFMVERDQPEQQVRESVFG